MNMRVFTDHELHATCELIVTRVEDDGTVIHFDPFHGAQLYTRPIGQSAQEWYAAHRAQ